MIKNEVNIWITLEEALRVEGNHTLLLEKDFRSLPAWDRLCFLLLWVDGSVHQLCTTNITHEFHASRWHCRLRYILCWREEPWRLDRWTKPCNIITKISKLISWCVNASIYYGKSLFLNTKVTKNRRQNH